jgi:hypothetical protein
MRRIFQIALVVLAANFAFAQINPQPITTNQAGVPTSALVTICTTNPGSGACGSLATTYTNAAAGTACTGTLTALNNTINPTIGAGCSNPGYSDSQGNVVAYAAAGQYFCQFSGATTSAYTRPCSVDGGTGGSGTPASPSTSVQFNNAGAFGGNANLTYVTGTSTLTNAGVEDITGTAANTFVAGIPYATLSAEAKSIEGASYGADTFAQNSGGSAVGVVYDSNGVDVSDVAGSYVIAVTNPTNHASNQADALSLYAGGTGAGNYQQLDGLTSNTYWSGTGTLQYQYGLFVAIPNVTNGPVSNSTGITIQDQSAASNPLIGNVVGLSVTSQGTSGTGVGISGLGGTGSYGLNITQGGAKNALGTGVTVSNGQFQIGASAGNTAPGNYVTMQGSTTNGGAVNISTSYWVSDGPLQLSTLTTAASPNVIINTNGTTAITKLSSNTYSTATNCAVNSVSPAACGAAAAGAVVVPTLTTTYTVSTTAVTAASRIMLTPMSFAGNLPGTPTCVTPAVTAEATISAISAGVSFTMALPSTTGQSCWQYSIVN